MSAIRVDLMQTALTVGTGRSELVVAFCGLDAPSAGMRSNTYPSRGSHLRAESVDPPVGLLDVGDAAERLGVTVRFVRRLVAERRIPYVKVGKFVRFDPVEVERWIDEHRIGQLELW